MANEPNVENEVEEVITEQGETEESERRQQQRRRRLPRQRDYAPDSGQSGDDYQRPGGRFQPRRKVCSFCTDKNRIITWKDVGMLRRYINNNGSIRARRKTGTCARHQRQLAVAIKRARHLALTPFTEEHVRLAGRS